MKTNKNPVRYENTLLHCIYRNPAKSEDEASRLLVSLFTMASHYSFSGISPNSFSYTFNHYILSFANDSCSSWNNFGKGISGDR
ncbi:hypothetical protein A4A49_21264 [Nicotiana attenuata]|uniref:Uncharacterized protein n=1 Tax=Nicotiana attenuata TaxID=49451 RepID=A0A314KVP9_NICAT|nr:hypothetical protein A4A49_21264 [Nicotiana attenuata]